MSARVLSLSLAAVIGVIALSGPAAARWGWHDGSGYHERAGGGHGDRGACAVRRDVVRLPRWRVRRLLRRRLFADILRLKDRGRWYVARGYTYSGRFRVVRVDPWSGRFLPAPRRVAPRVLSRAQARQRIRRRNVRLIGPLRRIDGAYTARAIDNRGARFRVWIDAESGRFRRSRPVRTAPRRPRYDAPLSRARARAIIRRRNMVPFTPLRRSGRAFTARAVNAKGTRFTIRVDVWTGRFRAVRLTPPRVRPAVRTIAPPRRNEKTGVIIDDGRADRPDRNYKIE